MSHTMPSISIPTSRDGLKEGLEEREKLLKSDDQSLLESSFTTKETMGINDHQEEDEKEVLNEFQNLGIEEEQVEAASGDDKGTGAGDFASASFDDEDSNLEECCKKMLVEDPSNPLILRYYAQLLESKGDLHGAEEYYFRATIADPKDGQILLRYAKLVWELHHDQHRALNYFERAVEAAPEDSHILAAYACFLLDLLEDNQGDLAGNDHNQIEKEKGVVGLQNSPSEEEKELVSPPLL